MAPTANRIVHTGLVARIGVATEIGRCLSAKKAHDQEAPTIIDLMISRPCSRYPRFQAAANDESVIPARTRINVHITAPVSTLSRRTGGTALSFTDDFFAMS